MINSPKDAWHAGIEYEQSMFSTTLVENDTTEDMTVSFGGEGINKLFILKPGSKVVVYNRIGKDAVILKDMI